MPRVSVIAKNYAKALFSAAKSSNSIDKVATELESFKKSFSIDFARELKNPVIAKSDSAKIIIEIAKGLKLGKLLSDFLVAVTRNKRLNLFPEIYEEFNRLLRLKK
jgi:F0F1-type ATP synthase delta subunit